MEEWARCANTGFYRRQWGHVKSPLAWYYVNPFDWTTITSAPQDGPYGQEGVTSVLWRRAPRYSKEALEGGISIVSEDLGTQANVRRRTHGWGQDVERAKEFGLSKRDLQRNFETAPQDARAQVLEGVRAMVTGYQYQAMINEEPSPVSQETVLVIERNSQAEREVEQIETRFPDVLRTLVRKDVARGLEEALAEFGIHEC